MSKREYKEDDTISEIKEIMSILGRGTQDGYVKGIHLAQILMYLRQTAQEKMKLTLAKLALICAMTQRSIRENYLEGIEAFGIIEVKCVGHDIIWKWIGKKGFNDGFSIPELGSMKKSKEEGDK